MTDRVERGRSAFERGVWGEAFTAFEGLDTLAQDDVERLAIAAHLVGERRASELAWERAHRLAAAAGDPDRSARCAFWLGFDLLLRGEEARASGWLARAERMAAEVPDGAAAGFLLIPAAVAAIGAGQPGVALELAHQMGARGAATADRDLSALALLCQGDALVASGEAGRGMRCFDEVMVALTAGEVSPITTGIVYCAVIEACMHARDLRRAGEWTEALAAWCATDEDLVPYRGQCLVHRSQVLMARGAWEQAEEAADRAQVHLASPEHPALGAALYQQGELHRVRGQLAQAEAAYRAASQHGRDPIPGFALLRLAQGRTEAAGAAARRMLHDTAADPERPVILAAVVEILVAAGDPDGAVAACEELEQRARTAGTELLSAMALTARAALTIAQGDAAAAGTPLREAIAHWRHLDMPFEEARARLLAAEACAAVGDQDAAELERDAAAVVFDRLGAPGVAAHDEPHGRETTLTDRECEVVRLVAAGRTNRQIAADLVISEHTVARHLQNIFVKLGVSSRAAATAYAYEHGIV